MGKNKSRHGFFVAILIVIFVSQLLGIFLLPCLGLDSIEIARIDGQSTEYPIWAIVLKPLMSIAMMVFIVALYYWKRWGFYGICALYATNIFTNMIMHGGMCNSFSNILIVGLLIAAMAVGKEHQKIWHHLE